MAGIEGIGYHPADTVFHRLDPRVKMLGLIAFSLTLTGAGFLALTFAGVLCVLFSFLGRIPLLSTLFSMRIFLILLLTVFVSRAVFTPGNAVLDAGLFQVTNAGMISGFRFCGRLFLVAWAGLWFISVTRPMEIKAAIEWLLKPVPGISEKRVGLMLSLLLRFIPIIFEQAGKTSEAQKARLMDVNKNPVKRLTCFVMSLLRNTFIHAERLTLALDARCYSDQRTGMRLNWRRTDGIAMICIVVICGVMVCLAF